MHKTELTVIFYVHQVRRSSIKHVFDMSRRSNPELTTFSRVLLIHRKHVIHIVKPSYEVSSY